MSDTRQEPHSLEAERSVLGCIFVRPDAFDDVAAVLAHPNDFYLPQHRAVWEAMLAVDRRHVPIDVVALANELEIRGSARMFEGGAHAFLVGLAHEVTTADNLEHWLRIVHDKAKLRRLIERAAEISARARGQDVEDVEAFAAEAERAIADAADERGSSRQPMQPFAAFVDSALETMRARVERRELPITTRWKSFNEALGGGLWPGLHVFTAGPGRGKTQWALQVALQAVQRHPSPVPVLYVGLELSREELNARALGLLAAEHDPDRRHWQWSEGWGGRDRGAFKAMEAQASTIKQLGSLLNLEVQPPFGWSPDTLAVRVKRLRADVGAQAPVLIVVDYLQLVSPVGAGGRRMELREVIAKATYHLRAVARDHGATVLALSSVSRQSSKELDDDKQKGEGDPRRWEAMGKEAGEIESSADTVMTMASEWVEGGGATTMHIAIAKVRAGKPAWAKLLFNGGWFWEPAPSESGTGPKTPPAGGKASDDDPGDPMKGIWR